MQKYSAIWEVKLDFNVDLLLREFRDAYPQNLKKVYSENENWKGVTVFKKGLDLHLNKLPELKNIVSQLGEENIVGINYFNLEANSNLHEHRDMNGNLLFGIVRIHIPLKTNEQAFMFIEKVKYHLSIGTAWALDTSGLHSLSNGPLDNRIHLVVDIKRSPKTRKYFPNYTMSVVLHLCKFLFIVCFKVLRDLFANPRSLIKRLKDKAKEYR